MQPTMNKDFIIKSIEAQIEKAIDEEIEEAKKRIDKRKAQIVSGVMLEIVKYVQIETRNDHVLFTIKFENK